MESFCTFMYRLRYGINIVLFRLVDLFFVDVHGVASQERYKFDARLRGKILSWKLTTVLKGFHYISPYIHHNA